MLFIWNSAHDRDMTICILNEGEVVVLEEKIPQSESASVIINIDDLTEGEYVLEITSSAGDWLRGKFEYSLRGN